MKLSKLYTNKPDLFNNVQFNEGLNIVVGKIFKPENRRLDSHNLGKSTFGKILNYCLLAGKKSASFLFKNGVFDDFVFFLEVKVDDSYVTIRRSVKDNSKISIACHKEKDQDFSQAEEDTWSHCDISIKRAKEILDATFDFTTIKPWDYRQAINYSIRSQSDYDDVFQLSKFKGSHKDWKPYLSNLFAFDYEKLIENYTLVDDIKKIDQELKAINIEVSDYLDSFDRLEGLILIKEKNLEQASHALSNFDFAIADYEKTKELIEDIEKKLAYLNAERYRLNREIIKVEDSLEKDVIKLKPDSLTQLFHEAGVIFAEQVKKRFDDLIQFNKKISQERNHLLRKELKELKKTFDTTHSDINELNKLRADKLVFLKEEDSLEKFKASHIDLTDAKAELINLKDKAVKLKKYHEKKRQLEKVQDRKKEIIGLIEEDVNTKIVDNDSIYNLIKIQFNGLIEFILSKQALIKTTQNKEGNLDFSTELLDSHGNATSESDGHTYKKFLCMAFDIAVNQVFLSKNFPHFIYHDGVFDNMDVRKKRNFIDLCKAITDDGLQYIITFIDSDLPDTEDGNNFFKAEDYVLELNDKGEEGRLFKIPLW